MFVAEEGGWGVPVPVPEVRICRRRATSELSWPGSGMLEAYGGGGKGLRFWS